MYLYKTYWQENYLEGNECTVEERTFYMWWRKEPYCFYLFIFFWMKMDSEDNNGI